jgi:hypothetical protein
VVRSTSSIANGVYGDLAELGDGTSFSYRVRMRELQSLVGSGGKGAASSERAIHGAPPTNAFRSKESSWDDLLDDTPTRVGPAGFALAAFAATNDPPTVTMPPPPNAGETLRLPPEENPLALSFSMPETVPPLNEQARTLRLGTASPNAAMVGAAPGPVPPSPFPVLARESASSATPHAPHAPHAPSSTAEAGRAPRRGSLTLVIGLLLLCTMALVVAGLRFGEVPFLR